MNVQITAKEDVKTNAKFPLSTFFSCHVYGGHGFNCLGGMEKRRKNLFTISSSIVIKEK